MTNVSWAFSTPLIAVSTAAWWDQKSLHPLVRTQCAFAQSYPGKYFRSVIVFQFDSIMFCVECSQKQEHANF